VKAKLVVGVAVAAICAGAAAPLEAGAPPVALCPSPSPRGVVQTVTLPGRPGNLLLTGRTLWVAVAARRPGGRGMLARVDAASGRVERTFRLPVNPYRIAYGFGSLWLTGEARAGTRRYGGAVLRLDPRTGRILRVIHGPILLGSAIAATPEGIWVGGGDVYRPGHPDRAGVRFVFKIGPRRNAVTQRIRLRTTTVIDLLGEGHALWATGWGAVVKLSPRGRVLYQRRFYGSGWSLARSPNAVWVSQPFSGNRFPRTQRPVQRLLQGTIRPPRLTVTELDAPPGLLDSAVGVVWMTGPEGLIRIPASQRPVPLQRLPVTALPDHMAAFDGGVWGSVHHTHRLAKICWE
jgi:hypothetical protein